MPELISTIAQLTGYAFTLALAATPTLACIAGCTRLGENRKGIGHTTSETIADLAYRMLYAIPTTGVTAIILHNIALMAGCAN